MSLPLLIGIAVVLPIVIVAALYAFARGTSWLALRPRTMGTMMIVFGLVYGGYGVWQMTQHVGIGNIAFVVGGMFFVIMGLYERYRGQPRKLD